MSKPADRSGKELPLFHPLDRAEWRAWLAEHYATATEVWLVSWKVATGRPRLSYGEAVEEALCFGWIDSVARSLDGERSAQRYSPRKDPRTWSVPNLERMERLIADGRMTPAGLAVFTPDPAAAPPRYQAGEPLPSWLEEGLRANAAAHRNFLALTPAQRRDYVRWIVEAKKEETRRRRMSEAVERLVRGEKIGLK
jgi:uncharacterized protein YdeI (YjbR/CyaY-like superfamily)